jgi:peptide/nickel transport system ATP-binding protein
MAAIRGRKISVIPQNSAVSLDPVYTVGKQLIETIHMHRKAGADDCRKLAQELLRKVGFGPNVINAHPHEMSGGMRQRAVIAMSISSNPILLLADEITSGLDVIVQDQILDLLDKLENELGMTMLLVTHDISIVAERCSRTVVMYGGKVMEAGKVEDVLRRPSHPYTIMLLRCLPDLTSEKDLVSIPDALPNASYSMQGCRFYSRCPFAKEQCREEEPKLRSVSGTGQQVACHFAEQAEVFRISVESGTSLPKIGEDN